MNKERWREIEEDERYLVSNHGRVMRITPGPGTWIGRITVGARRADGYRQLFTVRGFNMMHQLVAHVFLGPCPHGMEPNHKDGVRSNNKATNLEYLTRRDNILHGFNVLHPENREHRAATSRRHLKLAHGKSKPYIRTDRHRALNSAAHKGQKPWWLARGFSSLKAATRGVE